MRSSLLSKAEKAPDASLEVIQQDLKDCRNQTLDLCKNLSPLLFRTQSHPDFSPVGWHLGHIAYTESLWISERLGQLPVTSQYKPQYKKLFAADGLPKAERQNLPSDKEILSYLAVVRAQTEDCLPSINSSLEERQLWHWLIQHESQHVETMAMVLAMHRLAQEMPLSLSSIAPSQSNNLSDMVLIEVGEFYQGSDAVAAIDNERPMHSVSLSRYWIDRMPVTCSQYRQFVEAGGYRTQKWWSPEGWRWQQSAKVELPLYWMEDSAFDNYPVCGVSWYEAQAYARFVSKRLPTEAEWEKAAVSGCLDGLRMVWEWTDSWFNRYPGFRAFPYEGYSKIYFDRAHRVLRGGSFATPRWVLRNSFRNWYHPYRREMFSGFRCAV